MCGWSWWGQLVILCFKCGGDSVVYGLLGLGQRFLWVWLSLFEVREMVVKSCVSFICFVKVFICGLDGSKFVCWLTLIQIGF